LPSHQWIDPHLWDITTWFSIFIAPYVGRHFFPEASCYTRFVDLTRDRWKPWAHFLHRFELERPAALLLEIAGPLTILLAQVVYLGQPLLGGSKNRADWEALAGMLEDPAQAKAFANYLKEDQVS
jgi:hypothetical protein